MPYHLQFHATTVEPYLLGLDLSPAGREALLRVLRDIEGGADNFLSDPALRLAPGSDCISLELVFRDRERQIAHVLRLVSRVSAAPYGVLQIEYAEDIPYALQ